MDEMNALSKTIIMEIWKQNKASFEEELYGLLYCLIWIWFVPSNGPCAEI